MSLLITLLFLLAAVWLVSSIVLWSIRNGIAPMPTSPKAKRALLKALPPTISGTVYELGAGWGTLLLPLARRYPHAETIGFETSPIPYLVARARIRGFQNIKLQRQDFMQTDLADAGLVVCYLYPEAMRRLKIKFEVELKAGTWVISNTFAIPGWEPLQVVSVDDLYRNKIYIYKINNQRFKDEASFKIVQSRVNAHI